MDKVRVYDAMRDAILKDRQFFMGIAILFVLTYHILIAYKLPEIFGLKRFGYIGVDIFLFFSSLGLCYSYNKHSLKDFYMRRAMRILPLLFVLMLASTVVHQLKYNDFTVWDYICNFTTLSLYHVGGSFVDWYLCSLVVFYAAFPLLYKLCRNTPWIIIVSVFVSWAVCHFIEIPWDVDCFVSRWPIFLLGIFFYCDYRKCMPYMLLFCVGGIILFTCYIIGKAPAYFSRYLMTTLLAPGLILCISVICKYIYGG